MDILALPQDTVLHVFSFLSPIDLARGVRRTCKSWNNLSYDRSLWKHVKLYKYGLHNKFSSSSFIEFLRGISDRIQSLDLERTSFHSDGYLHSDFYCSDLKEINLFGCEISLDTIQGLLGKYKDIESVSLSLNIRSSSGFLAFVQQLSEMQKLKKLKIHNCCVGEKFLQGDAAKLRLHQLFKAHSNLVSLSFVQCKLPADLYKLAIENNSEIRELSFVMCGEIQADILRISAGAGFHKLETLNLAGTRCDDNVLKAVAEKAPRLEHVYMNACGSLITDNGISSLAERCRYITTLVISRTRFDKCTLTNAALESIAGSCKLLKQLIVNYCFGIGDLCLAALATGCKQLEDLEIAGCDGLSDYGLQRLVEKCPRLKKLNLSECEQITSKSVNDAVIKLRQLRFLNLENCYCLRDLKFRTTEIFKDTGGAHGDTVIGSKVEDKHENTGLEIKQPFASEEMHSHMFVLCIGYCSKISVECLRQISSFCPDIRELTLQECSNIADLSIELLAKSCKSLSKLNVSGGFGNYSTKLTDRSLHSIATWCQNLEHLVILQNPNITINGINGVVVECPRIGLVSVSTGNRVHIPGLKLAFSKVESKLIKLESMGKASRVDIYVYANKSAGLKQT